MKHWNGEYNHNIGYAPKHAKSKEETQREARDEYTKKRTPI